MFCWWCARSHHRIVSTFNNTANGGGDIYTVLVLVHSANVLARRKEKLYRVSFRPTGWWSKRWRYARVYTGLDYAQRDTYKLVVCLVSLLPFFLTVLLSVSVEESRGRGEYKSKNLDTCTECFWVHRNVEWTKDRYAERSECVLELIL